MDRSGRIIRTTGLTLEGYDPKTAWNKEFFSSNFTLTLATALHSRTTYTLCTYTKLKWLLARTPPQTGNAQTLQSLFSINHSLLDVIMITY